jgi:hypothetical protein
VAPTKEGKSAPQRAAAERFDDVLYQSASDDIKEHRSPTPKDETVLSAIRRLGGIRNVDRRTGYDEDVKYTSCNQASSTTRLA